MMGNTRSSTKRRTLSRMARSSSESCASIPKKSIMAGKLCGDDSARRRWDSNFACFGAKQAAVVDLITILVLPLVHHLVKQRPKRFLPSFATQMTSADRDFRGIIGLGGR